VKFTERKDYFYDPEVFKRSDSQTALKIHAEYVKKHSGRPTPKFLEVDRASSKFDALWHMPLDNRTQFSRTIEMPAIIQFEKPDWRLTKVGIVPQKKLVAWMANTLMAEADYFPVRGDMLVYEGYRYIILNVVLRPESYWQQTNVWLGMVCECSLPPDGDARPVLDNQNTVPAEMANTRPLPEA